MLGTLIVYASTSGSTRAVAQACATTLGPQTILFDLKALADSGARPPVGPFDLVLAGTPTYGKGDWHGSWAANFDRIAPLLLSARAVMLFGLGDARGHGKTFAGGLGVLADHVTSLGVTAIGAVPASTYRFDASPAMRAGTFPGLVIEYRRHRHAAPAKIEAWLQAGSGRYGSGWDDCARHKARHVASGE
jgi:flavodoxin I